MISTSRDSPGRQRPLRIAQFGTFEVENYGDLLFPLILTRELKARLGDIEIQLFSPLAGRYPADPRVAVHASTAEAIVRASMEFDAFIIGGGDLISFNPKIARIYDEQFDVGIGAHAACWALPVIHRVRPLPILWNAVGVPYEADSAQATLLKNICDDVDYLAVRDEISRERLERAGVLKSNISVVPDTAVLLAKHFPKTSLAPGAARLLENQGIRAEEFFVFQISKSWLGETPPDAVAQILRSLSSESGLRVLLLPIGYCHDDDQALRRIAEASSGDFLFIEPKLHPLDIAAVIAASACFIGTSLHGNITALAYGIPGVIVNFEGTSSKLEGFARWTSNAVPIVHRWDELQDKKRFTTIIDERNHSTRRAAGELLVSAAERHFDRLAQNARSQVAQPPHQSAARHAGGAEKRLEDLRLHMLKADAQRLRLDIAQLGAERTSKSGVAEAIRTLFAPSALSVASEISANDGMYGGNKEHYFGVGYSALRCLRLATLAAGNNVVNRILDLPCGYGRVTRALRASFPQAEIVACDRDRRAVDFCHETFGAVPVYSTEEAEELKLPGCFDLIWCGSLLTHLNAGRWATFLRLFESVLAPEGILVFTTHGRLVVKWMRRGTSDVGLTATQLYGLSEQPLQSLVQGYDREGFGYVDYPGQPGCGISASSLSFVIGEVQRNTRLRLVTIIENGWDNHHDVIACAKSQS